MIELLKSYGGLSYVSSMLSIVLFNVQLCILILILKMLTFAAFFLIFIIMLSCVGRIFFFSFHKLEIYNASPEFFYPSSVYETIFIQNHLYSKFCDSLNYSCSWNMKMHLLDRVSIAYFLALMID